MRGKPPPETEGLPGVATRERSSGAVVGDSPVRSNVGVDPTASVRRFGVGPTGRRSTSRHPVETVTERETVMSQRFVQSGVASEEFRQFLIGTAVLMIGAFILGAVVSPPDPFTQIAVTAVFLPVVLVGSYALAYRRGFEWT
jgi:hypothetical protein